MRSLPDVSEDFDDSFMLLKYLPKLTSLPRDKRLYLHAYRLLREAIMKIRTADFTDQTVFIKNALDNLSITEIFYIQTLGGSLGFVKKYAEVFQDHEILNALVRKEDDETEMVARSKGTEADVKKEHKGMVTDEIKMKTSGTNAVVESKDGNVDTQDLEIQVVEQHRFLMKKLALLKDRLSHEKMRNEALKEKSEEEVKDLKDKHNKETAKIEEMSKELKMGAGGGLKLQLQISQAQNKHCKEKISEIKLVKERLIQELGEKTSKLLFLEQYMKSEVLRKANLVKVNKSTCTQLDNVVQANEGKEDLDVDSREKMILKRMQRADIQILTIEYEKRKEEVKQLLEKGEYTYGIFDVGLNISSPEKEWLKDQWSNYQDRAQQHLGTLKDMMANQKNAIESSHNPNDIPAITMPSFEPFTVLCQVSAGSPSDIHFVVAPPCQSNHSIAAVNSNSPTEQNKPSVKAERSPGLSAIHMPTITNKRGSSVHMPVLSTIVDEQSSSRDMPDSKNQGSALRTEQMSPASSLVSNMKMLDRSPGNTSRRSRRLPMRKLGTGHSSVHGTDNKNVDGTMVSSKQQLHKASSCRSSSKDLDEILGSRKIQLPMKTSSSRSNTQKCHETLVSSKIQLPKPTSSSRSSSQKCHETLVSSENQQPMKNSSLRSGTQVSNHKEQDQLREMIIQKSDQLHDPQSADLEFLLESCWQLASLTLPKDNISESRSGLNQQQSYSEDGIRQMVSAPKGLSLPTEVACMKTSDLSSEGNYTASKEAASSSESKIPATSDIMPIILEAQLKNVKKTEEQESDNTFEANRKSKANLAYGSNDTSMPSEVDANFNDSSKASIAKEVGLDLSTAASFDTGIGDCSSVSEPSDLVTYLADSVKQAGVGDSPKQYIDSCEQDIVADSFEQDIVADEKLYTLSTDEVITVDASGYKMSERLYQHDSKSDNLESSWWNDFNDEISEQLHKDQSCTSGTHAIQGGVGSGDNVGAAKHRNEELSSLFLPAYAGGDVSSSVSGIQSDKRQARGKQVVSDPFLPEWAKDFSEL